MTMPALPDWLPWWVPILVAVPVGLWALSLLIMPFSVIGLKSRLESIEAELQELHTELRALVLRPVQPAPDRRGVPDAGYVPPQAPPARAPAPPAAPSPPEPPVRREDRRFGPSRDPSPRPPEDRPAPSPRAEPRLDWKRQ